MSDLNERPQPRLRWPEIAAISAILIIAGLLRFHRITANSFWTDELFTVQSTAAAGQDSRRPREGCARLSAAGR